MAHPVRAVCNALPRRMGVLIVACSALALWRPPLFSWVAPYVTPLLGCIMFGMGMTLRLEDFTRVLRRPRPLLAGLAVQFACMPLLAYGLCRLFALPPELAMGVILVGTAPGGTASNVLTYIAGGDVPYSVSLTALATLAALFLMPALTWLFGGVWVPVDVAALFVSILKIVIAPVALGLAAHRWCEGLCRRALPFLPAASALTIILVVAGIMAINAANILAAGSIVLAVVVCHNFCGLAIGYGAGRLLRLDAPGRRALCLEIGTQNSGLASALALAHFTPASAIAGALFSVCQNISGGLLANLFRSRGDGARCSADGPAAP